MKNKILLKYTENGILDYLADKDKDYAESISAEEKSDFCKEIAQRIEPLWKDIYDYENGGFFKRMWVRIKSIFRNRRGECTDIPQDVIESLAATFLPDIRAFFESEEGKKEFAEWKEQQKLKEALNDNNNHMYVIEDK